MVLWLSKFMDGTIPNHHFFQHHLREMIIWVTFSYFFQAFPRRKSKHLHISSEPMVTKPRDLLGGGFNDFFFRHSPGKLRKTTQLTRKINTHLTQLTNIFSDGLKPPPGVTCLYKIWLNNNRRKERKNQKRCLQWFFFWAADTRWAQKPLINRVSSRV